MNIFLQHPIYSLNTEPVLLPLQITIPAQISYMTNSPLSQLNSALESCSGELHEYNKATWDAFKEKWDTLPNGWFNILVNYTCFFGWKESINAGGVIGIGRQQRRPGYMFRNGTFWTPTTFL